MFFPLPPYSTFGNLITTLDRNTIHEVVPSIKSSGLRKHTYGQLLTGTYVKRDKAYKHIIPLTQIH